jgi:hypothetical protein
MVEDIAYNFPKNKGIPPFTWALHRLTAKFSMDVRERPKIYARADFAPPYGT